MRSASEKLMILLMFISAFYFIGCEKDPGVGGTASVTGVLVQRSYNESYTILQDESPSVDEDVYIVFGQDELLGDKTATNYNGKFGFSYLREGDYTIFYMTEDSLNPIKNKKEVLVNVNLKKGEALDLGELVQYKSIDFNDGTASIKGRVRQINYWKQSIYPNLIVRDTSLSQELEVYLTYDNSSFYDERIRTQDDGTFEFKGLIKGDYRIYCFSEDVSGKEEKIVVESHALIVEHGQKVDLGDLFTKEH